MSLYFVCPFCWAALPVNVCEPTVHDFTIEGTSSPGRPPKVTIAYRPRHLLTHECRPPRPVNVEARAPE